jgi:branched-chain amino acid transport system substrate-binding protein
LEKTWPTVNSDTKFQAEYSVTQTDFIPIIQQLRAANIKVVYVTGNPLGLGNFVRQARTAGLQALFVASDTAESQQFKDTARDDSNGTLFTFYPDPSRNPRAEAIAKKMQESGRPPSVRGLYAYAALQTWTQAVTKAGRFDAQTVASTLHAQSLDTIIGPVAFDQKGNIRELGYTFYQWQDGRAGEMNHRPPPPPPPPPK